MTVDDDLKAAGASWKKKDAAATVRALEDALMLARTDAPLDIRVAVPINHDHTGIGLYTPAPRDVVEGRRVRLYVEVANHALTMLSPGLFHAQLDVSGDFAFEDPALANDASGNGGLSGGLTKLAAGVGLGTQSFDTRTPTGVTSFGVEIHLGDKSPAGTYRVALKVKDAIGNKSASKDVRFVLG